MVHQHTNSYITSLKGNTTSIPSELGNSNHGLPGFLLSTGVYLALTGEMFVIPNNPGHMPNIAEGLIGVKIKDALTQQNNAIIRQVSNANI